MSTLTTSGTRSVLRIADLSASELHQLLDLAERMKAQPAGWLDALPGQTLVTLFEKPSTRTRVSFAAAAHRLGMLPLVLRSDELQLGACSLLEAGALAGMHVAIASPAGYAPDPAVVARAGELTAVSGGGSVEVTDDPFLAAAGAHAIYTDVWVSMGDDAERDRRLVDLAPYRVDTELMAHAAHDGVFLHCLPAHRGEEVAAEVIDGSASAVWDQAANRLPTEQALVYALCTGDWAGQARP